MQPIRIVNILKNNNWYEIPFETLRIGNIFRMFEPSGEEITVKNLKEFIAVSDPYLVDGVYGIKFRIN